MNNRRRRRRRRNKWKIVLFSFTVFKNNSVQVHNFPEIAADNQRSGKLTRRNRVVFIYLFRSRVVSKNINYPIC